jgi:hypothetical protein
VGPIAVIDLGELPSGQASHDAPARPWPRVRWALVALVSGLVLATVGGGVPAPRPLPMALLDVPTMSRVQAIEDRVFVIDSLQPGERTDDRMIAAYRLMGLQPLWRVDVPVSGEVAAITLVRDTLVLAGDPGTANAQPDGPAAVEPPDSVGLDVATGAVRWRARGFFEAITGSGRLLLTSPPANSASAPAGPQPSGASIAVHVVEAETGRVVASYTRPADALTFHRYEGEPRYEGERLTLLGALLPSGHVELRDPDTGRILRSGQIGPATGTDGLRYAETVGDLLMVRDGTRVTAYGLDRLDRRWTITLEAGQDGGVIWCGDVLCLYGGNSQGISALEPQTGRVKWSNPSWPSVLPVGERLIAVESDPQRDGQRLAVIDPETGHELRDLGEWQALHWNTPGGPVLGLRYDFTRAVVARLDAEPGPQILAVVHDVTRECWTNPPMLACRRTDNRLGIWVLPD